jgi:hypothetical protein
MGQVTPLVFLLVLLGSTQATHVFLHDLGQVLEMHKLEQGFSVVLTLNKGQNVLAANVVMSLRKNGMKNEIVATSHITDCPKVESLARGMDLLCSSADTDRLEYADWNYPEIWSAESTPRWLYALAVLRAGLDVLWVDTNAVFLQPMKPHLAGMRWAEVDIATNIGIWRGGRREMDLGMGYLKATAVVTTFMEDFWNRTVFNLKNETSVQDAKVWEDMLKERFPVQGLDEAQVLRKPFTNGVLTYLITPDSLFGRAGTIWQAYARARTEDRLPQPSDLPPIAQIEPMEKHKIIEGLQVSQLN